MAVPSVRRCNAQKRNRADHSGNAARSAQRRVEREQRCAEATKNGAEKARRRAEWEKRPDGQDEEL